MQISDMGRFRGIYYKSNIERSKTFISQNFKSRQTK